jgi:2-keto-4-pentenoate hydratase/2-oxohepta-3-ene-1,7-dioic acid hydratase in catechol pathway
LRRVPGSPATILDILNQGRNFLERLKKLIRTETKFIPVNLVRLLAPIPRPPKVLALAGNYSEHIKEASIKRGFKLGLSDSARHNTVPRPFLKPHTAVIGPDEQIPWPVFSEHIDYEIELAIVIGEKIRCVSPRQARNAIAGYTIANDISARTVTYKQGRNPRPWDEFYDWLNGKWADGFLPTGPYLLTADEVDDPQRLDMELKVNGKVRQKASTCQMIYPVWDIVSFLSHLMTLEPGDIIAAGTPAGVGVATGNFLQPGDVIECSIEKLGTLKNTLGPKPKKLFTPLKPG